MTKDELLEILNRDTGDFERDHSQADDALLAYIDDAEITAAFNSQPRHCA